MPIRKFFYLNLVICLLVILPFAVQGEEQESGSSCLITIPEITRPSTQQDMTLVDVRDTSDYMIYQITGSLNIKLHELKAKTFLKNKRLVLIGYGYDGERLLEACEALKSSGFNSVQVLDKGIAGWAITKDQSRDNPQIIKNVFYINPVDIAQIENTGRVLVIELSGKKSTPLNDYFEHIITVDATKNKPAKQISKILTSNSQKYDYIVVVDKDGQGYSSLYSLNYSNNNIPVMFL